MTVRRDTREYRALCRWLRGQQLPCWLCGGAIRYDLTGADAQRHSDAFTLDHVVAVANGGQNSRENARPAHRRCNSARGAHSAIKRQDNSRRW